MIFIIWLVSWLLCAAYESIFYSSFSSTGGIVMLFVVFLIGIYLFCWTLTKQQQMMF